MMKLKTTLFAVLAATAAFASLPASADGWDHDRGWGHERGWGGDRAWRQHEWEEHEEHEEHERWEHRYAPRYYQPAPPQVYYYPSGTYYTPPVVAYPQAPVYAPAPQAGFSFSFGAPW